MSLTLKYNLIFFILISAVNDQFGEILTHAFLKTINSKAWEIHFLNVKDIILFEAIINSVTALCVFYLVYFLRFFFLPWQNLFQFELSWLKNKIFFFVCKLFTLLILSHYIYFFIIVPIEYSWVCLFILDLDC